MTMNNLRPTIDDYMSRRLITFQPNDDIIAVSRILLEKRISGAPVVDDRGDLVGVLSKKDCFKVVYSASYHQDWGGKVKDYMTQDVQTIASGTDIVSATDFFLNSPYRRFPVVRGGRLVGQVSRSDMLTALIALWSDKTA